MIRSGRSAASCTESTEVEEHGRRIASLVKVGSALLVFFLGCGGQVVGPDYDDSDDASSEAGVGGTGSSSGGSAPSLAAGQCVKCDGRQDCGFCLVHGYNTTYICPPGKAPKSGCLSLGESHTSTDGYDFACYYCN